MSFLKFEQSACLYIPASVPNEKHYSQRVLKMAYYVTDGAGFHPSIKLT